MGIGISATLCGINDRQSDGNLCRLGADSRVERGRFGSGRGMSLPWFEYISDSALQQGDLIWRCPWIRVAQASIEQKTELKVDPVHAIVLPQSCDLVLRPNG